MMPENCITCHSLVKDYHGRLVYKCFKTRAEWTGYRVIRRFNRLNGGVIFRIPKKITPPTWCPEKVADCVH